MAKFPLSAIQDGSIELDNEILDDTSDTEAKDIPASPSLPEDNSMQPDKKSLKITLHRSDIDPPILEHGLPYYGDWSGSRATDLDNDPFLLRGPTFPAFESRRPRLSADWLQILQEGNKRYELRDVDRSTFRGSGWIDKDKSGDFNPDEQPEKLTRTQRNRIRKTTKAPNFGAGYRGDQKQNFHQPKTLSYEQGRKNGRSMILQLTFCSEDGIEKFGALAREFAPLEAINEASTRGPKSFNDSAYDSSKSTQKDGNRVNTRRFSRSVNEKILDQPCQNPEDIYENLLGHREGRGCKDCYDTGLECSLIDNYSSYPCDNCQEDDQDCNLITPRNENRICENCKRKRLQCSYSSTDEEDGLVACYNCQSANVKCIAGPGKSHRIDDVLATIGNKNNVPKSASKIQYPFCVDCRKNRVRTPAESAGQNRTCRECLTNKPSTTPESSPASDRLVKKLRAPPRAQIRKKVAASKAQTRTKNKVQATQGKGFKKQKKVEKCRSKKIDLNLGSDTEAAKPKFSASVPGGKVLYITTSFCHPIQFNWIPPPPLPPSPYSSPRFLSRIQASSFPCHFCTNPGPSYAIGGLGNKVVEVIQWAHDHTLGYEELDGGWSGAGQEQTRMCQQCTTERMLICFCTDHMIRPIKGLDPRVFDFESAFRGLLNQLLNRRASEDEKITDAAADATDVKWCSICPQPAFFECCVRPPFTKSGVETSPSDDIGCGLLLCEVCAFRMRGRRQYGTVQTALLSHAGNGDGAIGHTSEEPVKAIMTLDEHINAASRDTFHYNDGVRADACFLKADGELMRRQGAGNVANDEEIDVDEESDYDEIHHRAFKKCKWGMGSPIDLTR